MSTGNRGGWSDFQSVSALGVARSAQGQPIPKGFYLARHSWVSSIDESTNTVNSVTENHLLIDSF